MQHGFGLLTILIYLIDTYIYFHLSLLSSKRHILRIQIEDLIKYYFHISYCFYILKALTFHFQMIKIK